MPVTRRAAIAVAIALPLMLADCGGGGSGSVTVPLPTPSPTPSPTPPPTVNLVLLLGQSNAVGWALTARLQNTVYNPAGYGVAPPRVKIWYKDSRANPDLAADDGQWQDYRAGANSDVNASPRDQFGPELSLAQRLVATTGNDVYIVKAAFGGTSLSPLAGTSPPGNWTDTNARIALDYYFRRAVRDLRAARPGVTIRFQGILWWQGESDAAVNIPATEYRNRLDNLRSYFDTAIRTEFGDAYRWVLVGLNFQQNPGEPVINAALCSTAAADPRIGYIPTLTYPRRVDLTAAQSAPLPVEADKHTSYIGQLAVGEKAAEMMTSAAPPVETCP